MILAIETSCDDSAVALLSDEGKVLLNDISSQVDFHKKFGGIVPEIASRKHLSTLPLMLRHVLEEAEKFEEPLSAVAVTYSPGLIGSVLVGVSYAKALAWAKGIPLVEVDHLEGHLLAPMLDHPELTFPYLALIVSGGHTHLIEARAFGSYRLLGKTMDDAAGEAYDKVAKMLGFTYPGGPIIDRIALDRPPHDIRFPLPLQGKKTLDFSFSGLKTAVKNKAMELGVYVEKKELIGYDEFMQGTDKDRQLKIQNIAASFQERTVDILIRRIEEALKLTGLKRVAITGGVAANQGLQQALAKLGEKRRAQVFWPSRMNCTDNAAMIGLVAHHKLQDPTRDYMDYLELNASAKSPIGQLQTSKEQ